MTAKHISSQFDSELTTISSRILELGGLVEAQFATAIKALNTFDIKMAKEVIKIEEKINQMEVEINSDLTTMIMRRQPTARDLRLLIAIAKATTDLERMGDEITKIARFVQYIEQNQLKSGSPASELRPMASLTVSILNKALDTFARLDIESAVEIMHEDHDIDQAFGGIMRVLMTHMMEEPRMISLCIELLLVAKALERVGDHAKNLAELVVYVVKGEDIRHASLGEIAKLTELSK